MNLIFFLHMAVAWMLLEVGPFGPRAVLRCPISFGDAAARDNSKSIFISMHELLCDRHKLDHCGCSSFIIVGAVMLAKAIILSSVN